MDEDKTLHQLWFPSKGETRLRPKLVRGAPSMHLDRSSGVFTCTAYIGIALHVYSVQGFGRTPEEALESWCLGAETRYQMWWKEQVAKGIEGGSLVP